jgi:hypothetical protein
MSVRLVHPLATADVPSAQVLRKCKLFQDNACLAASPYHIRSVVGSCDFHDFVAALKDQSVTLTADNRPGLALLSEEFGFVGLSQSLRPDAVSSRILTLEEQVLHHTQQIAAIKTDVSGIAARLTESHEDVKPAQESPRALDSVILTEIPALFADFSGKRFNLLWRGSRDGFTPAAFHQRCDGRANTLTVVRDVNGNVFGGFTPIKWKAGKGRYGSDKSQRTFLFTLKNPYGIAPRKFRIKPGEVEYAVWFDSERGPVFGKGADLSIRNVAEAESYAGAFGTTYENDTGRDGKTLLAGVQRFNLNEIEVFELLDK